MAWTYAYRPVDFQLNYFNIQHHEKLNADVNKEHQKILVSIGKEYKLPKREKGEGETKCKGTKRMGQNDRVPTLSARCISMPLNFC